MKEQLRKTTIKIYKANNIAERGNISHVSNQNYINMIKLLGDKSTSDRKKEIHRSHNFIVELIATKYCGGHVHK